MVEKLKNNIKREKGITLVALVVTIVVLLILAFISISMLMGENGIINKASESKEETIKAKEREIIKLAYQDLDMEYTLEGTDITADRVWEKLKEYDGNIKVEMKAKEELGETEIVVEKNSGEEYAEITYEETGHKYAGSLLIDENKARYEVTYNANRGYGGPTKQIKIEGVPLTITGEIPERKGYSFKGWAKDSTAVVAEYVSGSQYTEDANITLYAVWQLREDIEPVAQIGDTKYPSIQEAIYDCSEEAGETATTIILLKNTEEEFRTFEGQNIILDLQGYTVTSESTGALCTNNGKIQIENGELRSNNGISIVNNGEITIGNNSNGIDDNTPTIYGKNVGIENNGIFNFYDGKIQGIVPIQGTTTSTPEEYGPVQTGYENGITTIQLRILTQYEARIGWVYYETLQGAVDIAREKETVTLIKDLQLKQVLEVSKDVILDLYGYTLTVATGINRVINNYGVLEITDSSIEKNGTINIESTSTVYGIYNYNNGNIKIAGGTVSSSNSSSDRYSYGIYNYGNGTVEVSEGTVSSGDCGIYNDKSGTVEVSGGTVSSGDYGIYNDKSGIVEVSGGIVSSRDYGIYNDESGTVEVTGGTVNGDYYGIYNNSSGTVEVIKGIVRGNTDTTHSSHGIYNYSNGTIKVTGGTVSSTSANISYGIYNYGNGTVEVVEGIISSDRYGIYNYGNGTVEVIGGLVSSSGYYSYGIYNNVSGSIVIGNKNEEIFRNKPIIKAEYTKSDNYGIGIYNNILGSIEFYNGIIQGTANASVGGITKIREGYEIENGIIEEKETIYLVNKKEKYIVQIDEKQYISLQEAINSIGENEEKTIEILKDFELNESINFNKNIILDLKGYIITNNYYKIENNNNLKIIDSTEDKQGKIENINIDIGILNNEECKIIIDGGTVSSISSNTNNSNNYGIYNVSGGTVEITGGTVNSSNSSDINSCTSYGIYNASNGTVEVTGGIVSSNASVNASNASSSSYGIINNGKVTITGGTINSNSSKSGVYGSGSSYGIHNGSSGTIEITGGAISSSGSRSSSYGIYNNGGIIEIVEGIISSSSSISYGIYNGSSGTIEITGGTVTSNSSGNNSYGIYNYSTGNIIIGTKGDGIVSEDEPYIQGEYTGTSTSLYGYGIYNTKGKLYLYDGKIEGSTKAVYDTITEIEENTYLNYNEDETILTLTKEKIPIAQIGDIIYTDLQEAINSVETTQTTIKILRNITYTSQHTEIVIPSSKNIILDLNGYKITSEVPNQVIKNEGNLEIIDSTEEQEGAIITSEETTIRNIEGAKLTITGGTIENRTKQSIYNEGEVIIQGGKVNGIDYGIYNYESGTVEVIGGTVSGKSYGIYNYESGTVKVAGGTINSDYYGIYNNGSGTIEITEGTVSCDGYDCYGIYNNSNGTVEVTGGLVSSNIDGRHSYGIYNNSNGIVEVIGGIISSSSYGYSYGIYNRDIGSIIIGKKRDGQISQNEPYIIGNSTSTLSSYVGYGIYNSEGNIYYYDGKIEGTTRGIYGSIAEIEYNTEILITKGETEVIQLEIKDTNVAQLNGIEYDSIQKAVKECGGTESTIEILRDSEPGATITIEENQNITIDLKGHTINNYTELQNKGTLKIIDTSTGQTGKIVGLTGTTILNTGILEIQGGVISKSVYGVNNSGIIILNGGTIDSNTYGIYNNSNGKVNIEKGIISSNTYGIYNYDSSSTVEINEGNITSNQYGIYNSKGTTNISSTGITNNDYGIYNAGGTTNIKEGAEVQSNTGIYSAGGTVNIGEQGTMNPDSPVVIGETYGLSVASTGTVYMYDGQVKGKEGAVEGYITYTEEGYVVANREEGEYKVNYLALGGTANAVAQVNGVSYSNLQSAINSITGGEEQTITLLNGIIAGEIYEIAEGQNIVLDMNGKTITTDLETVIKNNGNLTIVDTSNKNVASITSTTGVAIENSGTLTIGEDDGIENPNLITIEGATQGITNTGTLNVYDGTIRPE